MSLLIVADDLSGAAESAGAFAAHSGAVIEVRLAPVAGVLAGPLAIDTDSRALAAPDAENAVAAAVRSVPQGGLLYKKIDSLLRGNIAAETRAVAAAGRDVVVAAAVPRAGRTVRGGVVHLEGIPLHDTNAWAAEHNSAPRSIEDALERRCEIVSLEVVRSRGLTAALSAALDHGATPVCDAEVQADLDLVARAILRLDRPVAPVGAGGLARALAPLVSLEASESRFVGGATQVCVVVGSRSEVGAAQVAMLVATGMRSVQLRPGNIEQLQGDDCVVTLADAEPWDEASIALALTVVPRDAALVLTGGSTARTVLDALGVDRLYAEAELEAGVVLSTTADGRAVVTKPGNFGDDECLVRVVRTLKGHVLA